MCIICIEKKKYKKSIQQYNEFNKVIKTEMDTIFMNSENVKTSDPHRLILNLSDETNLKRSDKYVALSNLSVYYTWRDMKKSYKNDKLESALTWIEEFKLLHGSNFLSDIQDCFEYIIEKHETVTDNYSRMTYVNKIEIRITFKIKTGYYLEPLAPEILKLHGSNKSKVTKNENGKNVSYLEIT